jgi:hypothetical protein
VHAVPVRLDVGARAAGSAELRPLQVLKGGVETPTVTVVWGTAPDELRIGSLEGEWVCFLRAPSADAARQDSSRQYVGASPGAGLWAVEYTATGRPAIRYEGAVARVLVGPEQLTRGALFYTARGEPRGTDAVLLETLIAFVRWMSGEAPAQEADTP